MRKHSNENQFNSLLGLGHHSTRKSYYPELLKKIAELEKLNEGLEETVKERTNSLLEVNMALSKEITSKERIERQLKIAVQEAEEAKQSKDKYLAAASHDLLQPMNAARLLVTSLIERTQDSRHNQLAERINMALVGAEELLQDLLEISKLDTNATQSDITIFPVQQMLTGLVAEYQPMAQAKQLGFSYVPSHLHIRSDSHLLSRIVRNLISNAIRYTHRGRLLLGCRRRGDQLAIQVWDTGIGIAAEQQQQIFQEFHQLNEQRGGNGGVGLGLAIVERISTLLQHSIRVVSEPGKGSMFEVLVPLVEVAAEEKVQLQPMPLVANQLQFQQLKVLVIENDESIIFAMQNLLHDWGCEVTWLDSCSERVKAYIANDSVPDIILSDYHLHSECTGLDVIAAVKAGFETDIPAILISADNTDELKQQCRRLAIPRLQKPVRPGKLRALMQHQLD